MKKPRLARGGEREARIHLRKAAENLDAAKRSLALKHYDAASSSAAVAGINASDAITLWNKGVRSASASHSDAVGVLRSSNPTSMLVVADLENLLDIKNVAQYSETEMSERDATGAVRAAERMMDAANGVIGHGERSSTIEQSDRSVLKGVVERIQSERRSAQLCGAWMPIARARCILAAGHAGPHRARR